MLVPSTQELCALLESDPALAQLARYLFREKDELRLRGLVLVVVGLTQAKPTSPECLALMRSRLEEATLQARSGYSLLRRYWGQPEVESALEYAR